MNLFERIDPKRIPENIDPDDNLNVLQERILQYIFLGASILGGSVMIAIAIREIPMRRFGLIGIYGFVYLLELSLTYFRSISLRIRSLVLLGMFFLIGTVDLLQFGMSGEGRITMTVFCVVAAGLLNSRQGVRRFSGIISLALSLITLLVIGSLMSNQVIPVPPVEHLATSGNLAEWLNGSLVYLMVTTAAVSMVIVMTNGLRDALDNQKQLASELEEERSSLEERVAERTKELERRAAELEAASTLARDISAMSNLEELLNTAVELIRKEFGFYHAGLFLLDDKREFALLKAATGDAGRLMLENDHRLKVGEVGIVGYVVSKGEPRIALNVGEDAFHFKNPILPLTQSEMALPLKTSGKVIGALDVQSVKRNAFTHQDVQVLQTIADQLAVAIEKAELVHKLQDSIRELETGHQQITGSAWKSLLSNPQNRYSYRYHDSRIEADAEPTEEVKEALRAGKTIINTVQLNDEEQKVVNLAIPIKLRNKTLGVINVQFDKEEVSKDVMQLLETSSERLAFALDNARLMEEIQKQADRDRMVADITSNIRTSANIDEILRTAASEIGKNFGASEVVVQLKSTK